MSDLRKALEPFANIAAQLRKTAKDERWLETVLFYAGDDDDPTKWSLTGRAFDNALQALSVPAGDDEGLAVQGSTDELGGEIGTNSYVNPPNPSLIELVGELRGMLEKVLPITVCETPNYAELYFGEHQTQAMTMDPHTWLQIGKLLPRLLDCVEGRK